MTELKLRLRCAECGEDLEGRGVSQIDGDAGFFVRAKPCEKCVSDAERGHMRENRVLSAREALEWVGRVVADLDPAGLPEFLRGLCDAAIPREAIRLVESYEGVVRHVAPGGGSVNVIYESPDGDLIEHRYESGQFAGGRLPRRGADLVTHTCVVALPEEDGQ